MKNPQILPETSEELLRLVQNLAPLYTPEWKLPDGKSADWAIIKIFAKIMADVRQRLNRVPEQHFLAFLDLLGIHLKPAQPARVPVTFYLARGQSDRVFIPAATQAAAEATEEHPVLIFETEKNLSASAVQLQEVWCVDPDRDAIYDYTDDLKAGKGVVLLENGRPNLQKHELYLGHDELFDLKNPSKITLTFKDIVNIDYLRQSTWVYWGGDEQEIKLSVIHNGGNDLTFATSVPVQHKEINGVKSKWLRCSTKSWIADSPALTFSDIQIIGISPEIETGIIPDAAFYNTQPVDLVLPFYPFGRRPKTQDAFYIACRDAFSKTKAIFTLSSNINQPGVPTDNLQLSWQYWNGISWRPLNVSKNFPDKLEIKRMDDFSETTVNGEKNYWIRVCIVEGNYGRDEFEKDPNDATKWIVKANYSPPCLGKLTISYMLDETHSVRPQHCLACNNMEYRDLSKEMPASQENGVFPFLPLPEKGPTLYLGFDAPFGKGNASLFFDLQELASVTPEPARITWSYWRTGPQLLDKSDPKNAKVPFRTALLSDTQLLFYEPSALETMTETVSLASHDKDSGRITFMPALQKKYSRDAEICQRSFLDVVDNTAYLTRPGTLEFLAPTEHRATKKFCRERHWLMAAWEEAISPASLPAVQGVYPNTVWAQQVETIADEILSSSRGDKNILCRFSRIPVIAPEIWINEGKYLPPEDRLTIAPEDLREVQDDQGKIIETWVRWQPVPDFLDSGPRSRHCLIDGAEGTVVFGDGEYGLIPPIGRDNLTANYRTGGGVAGNIPAGEITSMKSSIAGIDRLVNHLAAAGGADTELLAEARQRGPHLVRHRDQAVTVEDFQRLAREASSYIARTKCLLHDNKAKIIVMPRGSEDRPLPSLELKKTVKSYLLARSLNVLLEHQLEILDPDYLEISIRADVIPVSLELVVPLEKAIRQRLQRYLHPLTGGPDGTGWEFGRSLYLSDVYALLEGIPGVDHVQKLALNDGDTVEIKEYETVCSGRHQINLKIRD